MGRSATTATLDFLNTKTGTKPLLVLGISWGLGVNWYSTRTVRIGGILRQGSITNISTLSVSRKDDSYGTTGSMSISLADLDGGLKFVIDNSITEKAIFTLYLAYEELGSDDMMPLFRGRVCGPVSWSEGNREVSLNLECQVEAEELGYSPTKDEIPDLWPGSQGVPWPHIFGKCAHVPTVKYFGKGVGLLMSGFRLHSKILDQNGEETNNVDVYNFNTEEKNVIYIDSDELPESREIVLNINDVYFKGILTDGVFKISESNMPRYRDVGIGARQETPEEKARQAFADPVAAHTLWLSGDENIAGCHCYFSDYKPNICIGQEGRKCEFLYPFTHKTTVKAEYPSDGVIKEVYSIPKCGLEDEEATNFYTDDRYKKTGYYKKLAEQLTQSPTAFWSVPADTKIYQVTDDPDVYILSAIKLDSVNGIYVKKKVRVSGEREREIFEPLEDTYYTITLNDSNVKNNIGNNVSTLQLLKPLTELGREQDYSDTIYVTATSTVGPNSADIIKYILENYCKRIFINRSSFTQVANQLPQSTYNNVTHERTDGIDANFAFLDRRDALKVAQEIAWQSRCALLIDSETATLKFLDTEPDAILTLDESLIELKSIEIGSTSIHDITTKLVSTWNKDYRDIPRLTRGNESEHQKVREIVRSMLDSRQSKLSSTEYSVYTNNIDLYGTKTREEQIYIYNEEKNILKTLKYWGYIFSNSWRKVKLRSFLPTLILQPWDAVLFNMSDTSILYGSTLGIVDNTSYDHKTKTVELELWMPVRAGTTSIDTKVWNE